MTAKDYYCSRDSNNPPNSTIVGGKLEIWSLRPWHAWFKTKQMENGSCLWKVKTLLWQTVLLQCNGVGHVMLMSFENCCLLLWLEDYLPTLLKLCFNNWTLVKFWNFSTFFVAGPPLIEKIGQSLISEKLSSGTWPHFPQLITFCILDGWLA